MNKHYYIAVNGQQTGPFTFEELKDKNIQRATLIWTEGMDNWTKAEDVAFVKDILWKSPPPIPQEEIKQQIPPSIPVTSQDGHDNHFGYELASSTQRFLASLVESIILCIPLFVIFGTDFGDFFSIKSLLTQIFFGVVSGALFYQSWSGNLGHKIFGLKVISSIDGKDQNNAVAGIKREVLKNVLFLIIVPVMWLLWDDNKQNLYDKVVNTIVVKRK